MLKNGGVFSLVYLLSYISSTFSAICFYYPSYPVSFVQKYKYCDEECCPGIQVTDQTVCCNKNNLTLSEYYPTTQWIIPVAVSCTMFGFFIITTAIVSCCLYNKRKRLRMTHPYITPTQMYYSNQTTPYTYNNTQTEYNVNNQTVSFNVPQPYPPPPPHSLPSAFQVDATAPPSYESILNPASIKN